MTKAAVQAAYHANVGNLRNIGHSTQLTPPAAKADEETVAVISMSFGFWPV